MYQKVTLVGHLGQDPKLRYTEHGSPFAVFSVAVDRGRKSEAQRAIWFQITVWGSLGENCAKTLGKGSQVFIEGEIQADPNTGAPRIFPRGNGTVGTALEVVGKRVLFLDNAPEIQLQARLL